MGIYAELNDKCVEVQEKKCQGSLVVAQLLAIKDNI